MRVALLLSCILLLGIEAAFPTSRDKYLWPFATNSIWNLPIGSNAVYVPAQLGTPSMPNLVVDPDVIILTPTSPVTPIYYSSAGWSGTSRCTPNAGNTVLLSAPLPSNLIVPNGLNNYATAILLQDNNTIIQTQPICKCTSSSLWTSLVKFPLQYLDKDGIGGAHGGSGLSAIGGTIRLGELLPNAIIRHTLKINLDSGRHYYKNPCYRWPANTCDSGAQTRYNGNIPGLVPGALLAIPKSVSLSALGLVSAPANSIAWTLQNYGGYIVDETGGEDVFTLSVEFGPAGDVRKEFESTYGYPMTADNSAMSLDIPKIFASLAFVDSWDLSVYNRVKNSNGAEGAGGGTPLQQWAPSIIPTQPPTYTTGGSTGSKFPFTIWDEGPASGWTVFSSGQISVYTADKYSGAVSDKLKTTAAWQNYDWQHNGFDVTGATRIHFALKTGQSASVCVLVQAYYGAWSSSLPNANLASYGGYPTNTAWKVYNIPLSVVNPSGGFIQHILISDCSGSGNHIFFLDQFQLLP